MGHNSADIACDVAESLLLDPDARQDAQAE